MKTMGFLWGIGGVIALLLSAIYRLAPRVLELGSYSLSAWQWLLLAVFVLYMLRAEGWKGFHLNFAPRVALRADFLRREGRPWMLLLAPLVCMGYLHATRRRRIVSLSLTAGLVLLIILVSHVPQPWRGIIDAGVVAGLLTGITSILWHGARVLGGRRPQMSADLP